MMRLFIYLFAASFTLCAGCSYIHKPFSIDKGEKTSLSIDARQRTILSAETKDGRKVCAEPSPDALVSIAAAGSFQVPIGTEKLIDAKGKTAESITALGTRTTTVQLLRDSLYRACEAYMNGALNNKEYKMLLVMFDDFVLTLFAIDELSKYDRPAPGESQPALPQANVPSVIKEIVIHYLDNQLKLYSAHDGNTKQQSHHEANPVK